MDEILKAARKELNISQEALAWDLSVSYTALNRWRDNHSKLSKLAMLQIKIIALAKAFLPR